MVVARLDGVGVAGLAAVSRRVRKTLSFISLVSMAIPSVPRRDERQQNPGRHVLAGSVRLFLAEALILPTGLVTLAFLTRHLGTGPYGLFTLTATVVTWIELSLMSLTARAINKCVSEAADWRPVATTALRIQLAAGLLVMLVVMLAAAPVAGVLGEPLLAGYLRLLALDIPLFCLAQAHRNILIGTGGYQQRAWLSAGRWLARLGLIVLFVGSGWSVNGAIAALIGTSLVELMLARRFVKPSLWGRSDFPVRRLLATAWPLFLLGMSLRLFDKIDIFVLKALGASAAQVGLYGAAQNLTIVPGLFAAAFTPLLLATLTRLRRDGAVAHARAMARDAVRLAGLLLPLAALAAGAAGEIVPLVAGAAFGEAAPILRWLLLGAAGSVVIAVGTVVLIAHDKPWWAAAVGGVVVGLAGVGQWWVIPRWGAAGAASCTAAVQWLGALFVMGAVAIKGKIFPPLGSVLRSLVISVAAFGLATWWPTPGGLVLVKLAVLSAGVVGAYLALGELDARERALVWSLLPWNSISRS